MLIIIHNNVSYQYKNVATKTRFSGGGNKHLLASIKTDVGE